MHTSKPTILIIDNDEGLVAALATRLKHYGFRCVTGGSGAQGITSFREEAIDLVITDLNMPVGNGIALVNALRATSNLPIIVITGYRESFRRELRAIPNVTVVEKPFDFTQLLDLIDAELVLAGRELPCQSKAQPQTTRGAGDKSQHLSKRV